MWIGPANQTDSDGIQQLFLQLNGHLEHLAHLWADRAFRNGDLGDWLQHALHITLQLVQKPDKALAFAHLPRRWVIERTFAWLGRYRRLSKDYEYLTENSEGLVYLASINRLLMRLAPT